MQIHRESERLKDTLAAIATMPFEFGRNRKQELTRLVYEISKRDDIAPSVLLKQVNTNNHFLNSRQAFNFLKDYFLQTRYPNTYLKKENSRFYLSKLSFDNRYVISKNHLSNFNPEQILIENDARDYHLTKLILKKFPKAKQVNINFLYDHIKSKKFSLTDDLPLQTNRIYDYNSRRKNLFLVKEKYDFLKPCPCTKGTLNCGYHILNLGFGCIYECSYCFLQSYTNVDGIILPVNIDDFLKRLDIFLEKKSKLLRIGTGEFSDSLSLDDLTGYAPILIDFFPTLQMQL